MLPKGILFDLDDTIIAYSSPADPTWRRLCDEYTKQYKMGDPDILYSTIKEISHWYWSDADRHKNGRNNLDNARREMMEIVFQN